MSNKPHSLLPRIKVIPETVDKLKADFDVSVTTIYKALNFASHSDQAIQIRKRAITLQDEVQRSNKKLVNTYDHESTNMILKPMTIQVMVIEQQIQFAHLARNSSLLVSDTFDAWFNTINDNILFYLEKHFNDQPVSTHELASLYKSMLANVVPHNIYPPRKIQEQITDEILKYIKHEPKRNH